MQTKIYIFLSALFTIFSARAESLLRTQCILFPGERTNIGIAYDDVYVILASRGQVVYGTPISTEVDLENGIIDISDFDSDIIRVPLAEAVVQPNRVIGD